jgi:hypothetical protein
MASDGDATPAYRGYRRQALYTLYRILADTIAKFQPEGKEDLAIFVEAGQLGEVVQVKALSHALMLSDLEPEKKDAFFARLAREAPLPDSLQIRLVSFGPCGPELRQAVGLQAPRQRHVAGKIHQANAAISLEVAIHLLEHIVIEEVEEGTLLEGVRGYLGQLCTGIDPDKAFDLMTAWLYKAAEARLPITRIELVQQIGSIGKFLDETATYLREWGTTIVPIEDIPLALGRQERLADEFYSGTLTRYEHIQAGLDVVRSDRLQAIAAQFTKATVAVMHGASGQGKTALAYRYLYELFPVYCRYQVRRIESVSHALSVATAIANHVRTLHLPVAFLLDVMPGDTAWTEVARQLVREPDVRLLVTIREEDWRRASLPDEAEAFAEIFLTLDQDEARSIYRVLTERTPSVHFLSFAEAWAASGEGGPLMEFVHLLTQGTTLRQRLENQVRRIQDEVLDEHRDLADLDVLRLVAVASACDARLRIDALARHLQLRIPERTLQRLEQEYLLCTSEEGTLVGGLHPLRSQILAELLAGSAPASWPRSAAECLPLLHEPDGQAFLFAAWVTHREDAPSLLSALASWEPTTWTGIVGVLRALLWLGVADYIEENRALLLEVSQEAGAGIMFRLDFDIAGLLPQGTTGLFDELSAQLGTVTEEQRRRIRAQRERQTDKARVYRPVTEWISGRIAAPRAPTTDTEWLAAAEVVFWLGYLHLVWPLKHWLPLPELESALGSLPLETLADVVLGFFSGYGAPFAPWYARHREQLLLRFRQETLSVKVEDDGTRITAYYILPQEGNSAQASLRVRDPGNAIHNSAMQRIWLLRRLVPDRAAYGCQGRGHHLGSLELTPDDAVKLAIPHHQLSPSWLGALNGLFRGLVRKLFRPASWQDYADGVLEIRQAVVQMLTQLVEGMEIYFRKQRMVPILGQSVSAEGWDRCRESLQAQPLLPQSAVDAWGLVDEETDSGWKAAEASDATDTGQQVTVSRRWLALQTYEPYLKRWSKYIQELGWFFQHGVGVLATNPVLGKQATTEEERQLVRQRAEGLGLHPATAPRQSMFHLIEASKHLVPFQREFSQLFGRLVSATSLQTLECREQTLLDNTLALWHWLAFAPRTVDQQPRLSSRLQFESTVTKCQRRLQQGLGGLSSSTLELALRTGVTWNQEPVLCVILDAHQALLQFQMLQPLLEVVHRALHSVSDRDLTRYGLTRKWESLMVVPLLDGRSVGGTAWRIGMSVFLNSDAVGDLKWWNLAQHPLPEDTSGSLGVTQWEQPDMRNTVRLGEEVVKLRLSVAHLDDIHQLPDLDTEGLEIARRYVQGYQETLSRQLQAAIDALAWMADFVSRMVQLPQLDQQTLAAISEGIQELMADVLPTPDFSTEAELPLTSMESWLARLEAGASKVLILQALAMDIIRLAH